MSETASYWKGWEDVARYLRHAYPESLFTPLSEDEIRVAVSAMNSAVPHASERLHAAWARHWADVLERDAAIAHRSAEAS